MAKIAGTIIADAPLSCVRLVWHLQQPSACQQGVSTCKGRELCMVSAYTFTTTRYVFFHTQQVYI